MNRKGMTLIEIMIAIMLLGVIAVAFLPSISSAYVNMKDTIRFTEDAFETQENIEEKMEIARGIGGSFDPTDPNMININPQDKVIFGKTISGYEIAEQISDRNKMYAFVSELRPDGYEVPIAENVRNIAKNNGGIIDIVYSKDENLRFNGENNITSETSHLLLDTIYKWYVSEEGFDPVISSDIDEIEEGTRYPIWPGDYIEIPNQTTRNFKPTDSVNLKDRYLLFSVIPIAKVGKYGSEVYSQPLWIQGLPYISNLALHLDASLLEGNPRVKQGVTSNVSEWKDERRNIVAKIDDSDPVPKLNYIAGENNTYGEKYISTNGNEFEIDENKNIRSNRATIFVVMKTGDKKSEILSKSDWKLEIDSNNRISFNNSSKYKLEDGNHIITGMLGTLNSNRGYYLYIDGGFKESNNNYRHKHEDRDDLIIGEEDDNKNVNIHEIIIYDRVLSLPEAKEVEEYLSKKYGVILVP